MRAALVAVVVLAACGPSDQARDCQIVKETLAREVKFPPPAADDAYTPGPKSGAHPATDRLRALCEL